MLSLAIIHNKTTSCMPVVAEGVTWNTERSSAPGSLKFSALADSDLLAEEGDEVSFSQDGKPIFSGFIFSRQQDKTGKIDFTCYDQLRYFKNKDTFSYENKSTSDLLKMFVKIYCLKAGTIVETGYKMSRTEDNTSLFDMFISANDATMQATGKLYVLYDNFGELCLQDAEALQLNLVITPISAQDVTYTTSIDENTYNVIKLYIENDDGKRTEFMEQGKEQVKRWGVLQYYEKAQNEKTAQAQARALLGLYNAKTISLKISGCLGDIRVRAGTSIILQDKKKDGKPYYHYMLVESAQHTFNSYLHTMDLTLKGGEVNS